jgi:hypothetical protein
VAWAMIDLEQHGKVAGVAIIILTAVLLLGLYLWFVGVWETPNAP